ncbi:MAG: hypothetical protein Q7U85_10335 [Rhodocyclaceae bacterium]|nr:hypothetical protein [Rhodocyclaceae bacterium]
MSKIHFLVFRAVLFICAACQLTGAQADVVASSGTRIENLSAALRKAGIWLPPAPDFEVAKGKAWVLSGNQEIVDLASGASILPRGFVAHSFARTRQGSVVIVTENVLGGFIRGFFVPTTKLPYGNMRVTAGPGETVLLFGGPDDNQVLISYDGHNHSTLLSLAEPIGAVTHVADRIFLSAGSKLLTVRPGEAPGLVFILPDGSSITGIAVDAALGVIYLATQDAIFSLGNGMATARIKGLGGAVQWRDGSLHVLDPVRGLYVKATFPAEPQ